MQKEDGAAYAPTVAGDLAVERHRLSPDGEGRLFREETYGALRLCGLTAEKTTREIARGRYLSLTPLSGTLADVSEPLADALLAAFRFFLGTAPLRLLVAGLGNRHLTPDALGPLTADGVEATAAIPERAAAALGISFSRVFVFIPDVLARTGMESAGQIAAIAALTGAEAVLTVDALAAASCERLLSVLELTDAGTVPGGGVGARRQPVSADVLGIPVLSLGVPTVVREGRAYFTVSRTTEEETAALAHTLSTAINRFARGETPRTSPPISRLFKKEEA